MKAPPVGSVSKRSWPPSRTIENSSDSSHLSFEEDAPRLQIQMEAAMEKGDSLVLARLSHRLKGSLSVFAAAAASKLTSRLEASAALGDLEAARRVYPLLANELDCLRANLAAAAAELAA